MKKTITVAALIIAFAVITGCASSAPKPPAKGKAAEFAAFDAVIEKSFNNLVEKIRPGTRIAFLPLRAADRNNSEYAYDTMDVMFNNVYGTNMVTRTELAAIIKEQNFQYSGMVDDATAVQFAKLTGAQAIIVGDISGADYTRRLVFRCLDVETGRVIAVTSERF